MARDDAVYVGLRGRQLAFKHGGATVGGVRGPNGGRTLGKHPDARTLPDELEWGYVGAGPGLLAEAILADRLGSDPDVGVSTAFMRDVVARLGSEFELPPRMLPTGSHAGAPSTCPDHRGPRGYSIASVRAAQPLPD